MWTKYTRNKNHIWHKTWPNNEHKIGATNVHETDKNQYRRKIDKNKITHQTQNRKYDCTGSHVQCSAIHSNWSILLQHVIHILKLAIEYGNVEPLFILTKSKKLYWNYLHFLYEYILSYDSLHTYQSTHSSNETSGKAHTIQHFRNVLVFWKCDQKSQELFTYFRKVHRNNTIQNKTFLESDRILIVGVI